MSKKFEFSYDPLIVGVDGNKEIVEFDDDTSDRVIRECFYDWLFNQIDAGYEEVKEADKE